MVVFAVVVASTTGVGLAVDSAVNVPWCRHVVDHSLRGADGVKLADVNGDTLLDIVTGWEESGKTRIYLHPGVAPHLVQKQWPVIDVGSTPSVEDAVFSDIDGDGALDVVTCCEGNTRSVVVFWAPAELAAEPHANGWLRAVFPATNRLTRWMYVMPADIDGQHGVDLFVGSKDPAGQVGWLRAPANPRDVAAWTYERLASARWIMSLEPCDVDSDGDVDLVYSDRYGEQSGVHWLENDGHGASWMRHGVGMFGRKDVMFFTLERSTPTARNLSLVAAAKPNACARFAPGRDLRGPWRVSAHVAYPRERFGHVKAVVVGDLDTDGKDEWVVTCEGADGNRSGLFAIWQPTSASPRYVDIGGPAGIKFDRVELLDIDRDGDLDVLTCEERAGLGVVWYENPERAGRNAGPANVCGK